MNAFTLEAEGVSKFFPGVKAFDNISLRVRPGTVHALMGENDAGKSTLVKCLISIYRPDKGSTRMKGEPMEFTDTMDALRSGISMIHQELNLMPHMTVAENIWLGREPTKYGFVDHGQLVRQTQALLDELNIRLTANRLMGDLSIAAQQMVEVTKAASWNANIVIMDEPISALTEGEVTHLFIIIRNLHAQGKVIIYVSYKMDEIFAITNETSVFHDDTWVGNRNTTKFIHQSLITRVVGRELTQLLPELNSTVGGEVLTVRNLTRHDVFHDVSFTVRRGEILGVTGLAGTGRSEVMESLFSMERFGSGEVLINGAPVTIDSPSVATEKGMTLLAEDRKESDLFLVLSVLENMSIVRMPEYIDKNGFVQHVKMTEDYMEQIHRLSIKTPTMDQIISNLSGGNQQKVLIARWLLTQPKILVLDEPARGIDVGAKAEIYHLISELANRGVAAIMVSSELPEVLDMSDRVMVMHGGCITGILERDGADQETILSLTSH